MYLFISHSSKEASVARELCRVLEENGSDCFLAPRNIRTGYEYASEIVNGIDRSDAILLLLSENANASPHVLREIERAVSKSIPIIVYKLEEVNLSKSLQYFLMTHQWLNAESGNYDVLIQCINDLKNNTSNAPDMMQATKQSSGKKNYLIAGILSATIIVCSCLIYMMTQVERDDGNKITKDDARSQSSAKNTTENIITHTNSTNIDIQLGDSVSFGQYNGEAIQWNVIKLSENKAEAVLLAKNLLTFKAFNGAESGHFCRDENRSYNSSDPEIQENPELEAYVFGNSNWETSDIRVWLNSDKEYVTYEGHGPIAGAMGSSLNAYNLEVGFLYNFSEAERAAIKETTVKTKGNTLAESSTITTKDRVFLLSMEELKWLEEASVGLFTTPTKQAIKNNESYYYDDYCLNVFHTDSCMWWLREPLEDSASACYLVSHGAKPDETYNNALAGVEDFGIRPAITVDLTSDCIKFDK